MVMSKQRCNLFDCYLVLVVNVALHVQCAMVVVPADEMPKLCLDLFCLQSHCMHLNSTQRILSTLGL